jgi:squalene synthase HpnC
VVLGRAGGENFPVALRVLPGALRSDLTAIYGYARLVDQIGDGYSGDRLGALDWLDAEVDAALGLATRAGPAGVHPLVAAAVATVAAHAVDPQALRDLVAANRQDQVVSTYATFDDLLAYCRMSANPVGRLVLGVFDAVTPERVAWSDAVCSGLQLAEHCQDVAEDAGAGRVYLPVEDLERFRVDPAALGATGPASPGLRALTAFEVWRARRLLAEGTPLIGSLRGWARVAVAGFVAGGRGALDAIADAGFDPLAGAPRPSRRRIAQHALAELSARAGRAA